MDRYHHGDLKNALISAGLEVLTREGVAGLTLRKVAREVGVSHAAPYAHFADKQALIAAICTEGFRRMYDVVSSAAGQYPNEPEKRIVEAGLAYLQFAETTPELFKIMFSGILEHNRKYPEFEKVTGDNFRMVVGLVEASQAVGVLRPGPSNLMAVSLWAAVHGLAALVLDGQIPYHVFDQYSLRSLWVATLQQFTDHDLGE